MRFEQRLRDGIHSGEIVLAFRRWKRSQVVPGHHYRTGIDMVEVESVDVVEPSSVDAAQAREAGYTSVGDLLASLRGDPAFPVYRVRLHRIDGPDPRDELARTASLTEADVAAITARLARMDKSSEPRAVDRRGARADRRPARDRVHGPGGSHRLGAAGLQAARQEAEGPWTDPQPRRWLPVVAARRVLPEVYAAWNASRSGTGSSSDDERAVTGAPGLAASARLSLTCTVSRSAPKTRT